MCLLCNTYTMKRSCLLCIALLSTCSGLRAPVSLSTGEQHAQVSRRSVLSTSGAAVAASIAATQLPLQSKAAADVAATLPAEAYTLIGGEMKSCKVLNGMWQLSGAHGFNPQLDPALNAMQKLASAGFTTFDLVSYICHLSESLYLFWSPVQYLQLLKSLRSSSCSKHDPLHESY